MLEFQTIRHLEGAASEAFHTFLKDTPTPLARAESSHYR